MAIFASRFGGIYVPVAVSQSEILAHVHEKPPLSMLVMGYLAYRSIKNLELICAKCSHKTCTCNHLLLILLFLH